MRSRSFFSGKEIGYALLAVGELRLLCRILLVQLAEKPGEAFKFGGPHPALLDQHVLLVEDARSLAFLLLNFLQQGEELFPGTFRILAVLFDLRLDFFELGP